MLKGGKIKRELPPCSLLLPCPLLQSPSSLYSPSFLSSPSSSTIPLSRSQRNDEGVAPLAWRSSQAKSMPWAGRSLSPSRPQENPPASRTLVPRPDLDSDRLPLGSMGALTHLGEGQTQQPGGRGSAQEAFLEPGYRCGSKDIVGLAHGGRTRWFHL